MRHPIVDVAQGLGAKAVIALAAGAARGDEPRAAKNAQVLRDGRARHGEGGGDATHRYFASAEQIEDAAAGGVADDSEDIGGEAARGLARRIHRMK